MRGRPLRGRPMTVSAVLFGVAAYFILASAAFAQDSSISGYGGSAGEVSAGLGSGGGVSAGGNLPFTGLDLMYTVIAGAAMVLVGLTLRRFGGSRA
jgi:hypothetical protein